MTDTPVSKFFQSQRLRLHYVEWGRPDAPPVLLIHGVRDQCRSWDQTARRLCADWRVIAPDLRGHGDSEWSPDGEYSIHTFLYDLAELVHHLGLEQTAIVAHSMGGGIALQYAAIYPERVAKLAAIEGLGHPPDLFAEKSAQPWPLRWREWVEARRSAAAKQPRRYARFEDAAARLRVENPRFTDEQVLHLARHNILRNEDGAYRWKFDNMLYAFTPLDEHHYAAGACWRSVLCPVLLLNGAESFASNPAEDGRLRHFRDARAIAFEDAGHWPHLDQFERFIETVGKFLGPAQAS